MDIKNKPKLVACDGAIVIGDVDEREYYLSLQADVLARTLWGEARGEGSQGMEAVASVIINRVKVAEDSNRPYWWGNDVVQICQKPYQFSCWNRSDVNYKAIQQVDEADLHFVTALRIARRALIGVLRDSTCGATHYHAAGIDPFWARNEKPVATIGRHIFYTLS